MPIKRDLTLTAVYEDTYKVTVDLGDAVLASELPEGWTLVKGNQLQKDYFPHEGEISYDEIMAELEDVLFYVGSDTDRDATTIKSWKSASPFWKKTLTGNETFTVTDYYDVYEVYMDFKGGAIQEGYDAPDTPLTWKEVYSRDGKTITGYKTYINEKEEPWSYKEIEKLWKDVPIYKNGISKKVTAWFHTPSSWHNDNVNSDTVFAASYGDTYTVGFSTEDINKGSVERAKYDVADGSSYDATTDTVIIAGEEVCKATPSDEVVEGILIWEFDRWDVAEYLDNSSLIVKENTGFIDSNRYMFKAVFKQVLKPVTVTLIGGEEATPEQIILPNTRANDVIADPSAQFTRKGYSIKGWDIIDPATGKPTGEQWNFAASLKDDLTLQAH